MIISIASGKGGTGKTTVAVGLALSTENVQLIDCDVEEPNVHILLKPKIYEEKPVYSLVPHILEEKCSHCGKCAEFCQYHALFVAQKVFWSSQNSATAVDYAQSYVQKRP